MKTLMAAISILLMSPVIAGDEKTFVLPAQQDSAAVTLCATGETSNNPRPDDVLASFPLNSAGTVAVLTRDNATSIVSNVGRAIALSPNVTKDPKWNSAWATIAYWEKAATCGLGSSESVPSTK